MPIVRSTVNAAWKLMPTEATGYTGFKGFTSTRTGGPTKIVIQRLLPPLLKDVHASLENGRPDENFSYSYKTERTAEVSERMEAAIAARMAERADLITATAKWHQHLMAVYPAWASEYEAPPFPKDNEHDRLVVPSLELAEEYGAPNEASAAAISLSKLATLKQSAWSKITAFLTANEPKLLSALDDVWALNIATHAQENGLDDPGQKAAEHMRRQEFESRLDRYFLAAFGAQGAKWVSDSDDRKAAVESLESLVAECESEVAPELSASASSGYRDYLRAVAAPARPALRGFDGEISGLSAIPSTIEERLKRIFDSLEKEPGVRDLGGTKVKLRVPAESASEAVTRTIMASGQPFALVSPVARVIVLTMLRATKSLRWVPPRTPTHLRQAPQTSTEPPDKHFSIQWQKRAVKAYSRSASPGSSLREYLQRPHLTFLSRAWVRAGVQDLGEMHGQTADARMVWEHVTGAFESELRNLPTLAQKLERQDRGPRDVHQRLPVSYDAWAETIETVLGAGDREAMADQAHSHPFDDDEIEPDWVSPTWTRVDRTYGDLAEAVVATFGEPAMQQFWIAAEAGFVEVCASLWATWEQQRSESPVADYSVDMVVSTWVTPISPLRRALLPDLLVFASERDQRRFTNVRKTVLTLATAPRVPDAQETDLWWELRKSYVKAKGYAPDQGEFWRWLHAMPSLVQAARLVADATARRDPGSE